MPRPENRHSGALGFLLASNLKRYRFTLSTQRRPCRARAIDFIETPPERVRIKWEGSCFEAEGGGHTGPRLVGSRDVRHLSGRCAALETFPRPAAGRILRDSARDQDGEI